MMVLGGSSMDKFFRKLEMEYNLDNPQLTRFTLHLGFVLTRMGLKGETGVFGRSFPDWRSRASARPSVEVTLMNEEA